MIIRPFDSSGDISPVINLSDMVGGKEAVGRAVDLRLHFIYGEWFEDQTIGFRVPEFLADNARQGDVDLLAKYISSYIANTEGVKAVTDVVSTYNNRVMTFYCSVITNDGETTTVEVDTDGIL